MLSALLLIPLIAAMMTCLLPQSLPSSRFRSISVVVLTALLGLSLSLVVNFDPHVGRDAVHRTTALGRLAWA